MVGVDHAARTHSVNSPSMTGSVEKKNDSDDDDDDINDNDNRKMILDMSNASIKCKCKFLSVCCL